LYPAVNIRDY